MQLGTKATFFINIMFIRPLVQLACSYYIFPVQLLLQYYTEVSEHLLRVPGKFRGEGKRSGLQCLLNLNKLPAYSEEDKRLCTGRGATEKRNRKGN